MLLEIVSFRCELGRNTRLLFFTARDRTDSEIFSFYKQGQPVARIMFRRFTCEFVAYYTMFEALDIRPRVRFPVDTIPSKSPRKSGKIERTRGRSRRFAADCRRNETATRLVNTAAVGENRPSSYRLRRLGISASGTRRHDNYNVAVGRATENNITTFYPSAGMTSSRA